MFYGDRNLICSCAPVSEYEDAFDEGEAHEGVTNEGVINEEKKTYTSPIVGKWHTLSQWLISCHFIFCGHANILSWPFCVAKYLVFSDILYQPTFKRLMLTPCLLVNKLT